MKFPVILFSKKSRPYLYENIEQLKTTNSLAIKNNFFDNASLIDVEGKYFEIKSVRKIKALGFFWGYNIFLNRKIEVELDLVQNNSIYSVKSLWEFLSKYKYHINDKNMLNELKESVDLEGFFNIYSSYQNTNFKK